MIGARTRRVLALVAGSIVASILALSPAAAQTLPNSQPPHTRAQIAAVQSQLSALGYDPGPVDGVLGPRTRDAIRFYELVAGLEATGEITPVLTEALSDELLRDEHLQPDNESDLVPPAPQVQ